MNYKTALFCEFDKYAAESYCAVHGVDPSLNIGDITKADEKTVPDFNVMFGGSPCQDFSIAGKQGGQRGDVKLAATHITLSKPTIPHARIVRNADQQKLIKPVLPSWLSGCGFSVKRNPDSPFTKTSKIS